MKQLCTPKVSLKNNERLSFYIDADETWKLRRGRWKATVTDIDTKVRYELRGCACDIAYCMCDAYVYKTLSKLK